MEQMHRLANITPAMWAKGEKELLDVVRTHWDEVPIVSFSNVIKLPGQTLVRFRGMVQDSLSMEYYLHEYEVYDKVTNEKKKMTMKFMDEAAYDGEREDFSTTDSNHTYAHRQVYVGVPIPGFNEWEHTIEQNVGLSIESIPTAKRSIEDVEMERGDPNSTSGTKKQCTSMTLSDHKTIFCPQSSDSPNLEKKCFFIVYDDAKPLQVTDVVEVLGFVSHTEGPIVRIHCVTFRNINHCNLMAYSDRLTLDRYPTFKNDLHFVLSQVLLGDRLAAEYLIYHLISRIYTRDNVFPIGKFCLNISQIPASILNEFGKGVYEFMQLLVPVSHYMPMTIENLNTLCLLPKKDYETDTLKTGLLQVPRSTHIMLDETKLEEGQLNESGVAAMNALNLAIVQQRVPYDCMNYSVNLDCDIPFLIISEGKSLLPSDHHVYLQPDETCLSVYPDTLTAAKLMLKNFINELRRYLAQARHTDFQFDDNIMGVIQEDFVRLRQTRSVVADDLHRLLVLSRLIAISDGKTVLDVCSWQKACQLDEMRANRIEPV